MAIVVVDGKVFVNGENLGEVSNIDNGVVNIGYDRPRIYVIGTRGGEVNEK